MCMSPNLNICQCSILCCEFVIPTWLASENSRKDNSNSNNYLAYLKKSVSTPLRSHHNSDTGTGVFNDGMFSSGASFGFWMKETFLCVDVVNGREGGLVFFQWVIVVDLFIFWLMSGSALFSLSLILNSDGDLRCKNKYLMYCLPTVI